MGRLKPFIVATYTDYTIMLMATDVDDAIVRASEYYFSKYGEDRDDWTAYDLTGDYLEEDTIWDLTNADIDIFDFSSGELL